MRRLSLLILTAAFAGLVVGLGTRPQPGGAAFPGANGKIAFTSDRDSVGEITTLLIYVMNADGSGQNRLTSDYPYRDGDPAWSPDGSKIAFVTHRNVPPQYSELYVMNADGSGQTSLSSHAGGNGDPAWSPDGSQIAYASWAREAEFFVVDIYAMNVDGSGEINLTNGAADELSGAPAWSPDGSKIAFTTGRDVNSEVYVMNADGTGVTNLTDPAGGGDPNWSPDGSQIAFERGGEIYVMNADGSGQTNVSNNPAGDADPAWSPDGTEIAFASDRDGNSEIYVMNADGSGQANLTNHSAFDGEPDWQPLDADGDGLSGAFEAGFGGGGINITNPETGNTAAPTGSAAGGSTITSGSITVTFPPGTQVLGGGPNAIEIRFALGTRPALEIRNAGLAPTERKTVEMPLGTGNAVCINDRVNAIIESVVGGRCDPPPADPSLCPPDKIKIAVPTMVGSSTSVATKTPAPECTPTTYTVTRVTSDRVRVAGLVHTAIGIVAAAPPPLGGVAAYPDLPSGGNAGLLAGVLAAVAAGALGLGGVAWRRRRRWPSPPTPPRQGRGSRVAAGRTSSFEH